MTVKFNMRYCRLCEKEKPLCNSHVIPKFVARYLKHTGATGFLTAITTDQQPSREQDLFTKKLLCKDCELLLSSIEDYFKKTVFLPKTQNALSTIPIDIRLAQFVVSVSLRSLWVYREAEMELAIKYQGQLQNLENEWKVFVRSGKSEDLTLRNSHHILFTSLEMCRAASLNYPNMTASIFRSSAFFIHEAFGTAFFFSNLAGIQLISLINAESLPASRGTEVYPTQTFGLELPPGIGWGGYFDALKFLDYTLELGKSNQTQAQIDRANQLMNTQKAAESMDVAIQQFQKNMHQNAITSNKKT